MSSHISELYVALAVAVTAYSYALRYHGARSRMIQVNEARIAGVPGIFKSSDFAQGASDIHLSLASLNVYASPGRCDRLPYESSGMLRFYHAHECNICDSSFFHSILFLSCHCSASSELCGNLARLLKHASFFRDDFESGSLISLLAIYPLLQLCGIAARGQPAIRLHAKSKGSGRPDKSGV